MLIRTHEVNGIACPYCPNAVFPDGLTATDHALTHKGIRRAVDEGAVLCGLCFALIGNAHAPILNGSACPRWALAKQGFAWVS